MEEVLELDVAPLEVDAGAAGRGDHAGVDRGHCLEARTRLDVDVLPAPVEVRQHQVGAVRDVLGDPAHVAHAAMDGFVVRSFAQRDVAALAPHRAHDEGIEVSDEERTRAAALGREGAQGLAQRQHVEAILVSSAGAEPHRQGDGAPALGREVGDETRDARAQIPPGGAGRFVEQALLDQHDDARAAAGLRAQGLEPLDLGVAVTVRSKPLKRSQRATTSDVASCGSGAATSGSDARKRAVHMGSNLHPRAGAQSSGRRADVH